MPEKYILFPPLLFRAFKNNPTNDDYFTEYKRCRVLARRVIRDAKRTSWRDFVSQINRDTPVKTIWNYIKRIIGKFKSRTIYLCLDGHLIDDPKLIAEEITQHFDSVSADSNFF